MALDNIRRYYSEMFQSEKKAADYILENANKVVDMSIAELARESGTSDATIIRMCRHIGYTGFYQMKISLASSLGKASAVETEQKRPQDVVGFFNMVSQSISDAAKNINMEIFLTCADLISRAGTVYLTAWGNTGEIASDFAHRLARSGIKSFVSDVPEYSMRSIGLGGPEDVLVAISHSGTTIHVIQAIELARELGMKTILITDAAMSKAAESSDYVLCTSVKNQLFYDFGGASHVFELVVVDALLYFIKGRAESMKMGEKTETLMSSYKL